MRDLAFCRRIHIGLLRHRTTPGRGGVIPVVVVVVVTVVVVVVDVVFASAIWVACESIASKIKARAATPAETMGASAILPVVLLLFAESVPKWCRCHQPGCQGMEKNWMTRMKRMLQRWWAHWYTENGNCNCAPNKWSIHSGQGTPPATQAPHIWKRKPKDSHFFFSSGTLPSTARASVITVNGRAL